MKNATALFIISLLTCSLLSIWRLASAEEVIFIGNIRPIVQVSVVSKVSTPGRLLSYSVDVGDTVKKGQIIAQIETEDLVTRVQQAKADVQSTKANLDNAQILSEFNMKAEYAQAIANVKRLEASLLKAKIEVEVHEIQARSSVKRSKANLSLAEARLGVSKAKYRPEEIERAELRRDLAKLSYERLRALHKDDYLSEDELDQSKLQYDVAEVELQLLVQGSRKEDIDMALSNVLISRAALEADEANLKQLQTSTVDVESVKSQLEQANANLKVSEMALTNGLWKLEITKAEANYLKAKSALEYANRQLQEATLRSPIDGLVATRELDPGNLVALNMTLFTLVDIDLIRLHANLSERSMLAFSHSTHLQISLNDTQSDEVIIDQVLKIIKVYFSPIVESVTQSAEVIIEISNPNQKLKPGMLVSTRLLTKTNDTK